MRSEVFIPRLLCRFEACARLRVAEVRRAVERMQLGPSRFLKIHTLLPTNVRSRYSGVAAARAHEPVILRSVKERVVVIAGGRAEFPPAAERRLQRRDARDPAGVLPFDHI